MYFLSLSDRHLPDQYIHQHPQTPVVSLCPNCLSGQYLRGQELWGPKDSWQALWGHPEVTGGGVLWDC